MAVKKGKTKYICSECGYSSLKWMGKCPNCDSWGTFEEEIDIKSTFKNVESQEVSIKKITEIYNIILKKNFILSLNFAIIAPNFILI